MKQRTLCIDGHGWDLPFSEENMCLLTLYSGSMDSTLTARQLSILVKRSHRVD